MCISDCNEGSRLQMNRYSSPLRVLGRFITIFGEETITTLRELPIQQQQNFFFFFYLKKKGGGGGVRDFNTFFKIEVIGALYLVLLKKLLKNLFTIIYFPL